MGPVYYGHLGTKKCPDYQGVLIFQVRLYDKVPFAIGIITECVDYACMYPYFLHACKCPD